MEQPNLSSTIENKNEVNQESVEKIEKALADFSSNPDIVILEEAVTASPSRLAELYDKSTTSVKAILGAMLFAVTVQASAGQDSQSVEKVEPEVSFSQTMEMKEKIKEITGIDIVAEARKFDREVKLYTPEKPTTRTIVNLGQTHALMGNPESNFYSKNGILKSQKEISGMLMSFSVVSQSKIKVFTEGYAEENKKVFNFFHDLSNFLKNNIVSFSELKDMYNQAIIPRGDERLLVIFNKICADKLVSMGFKETSPLIYEKEGEILKLKPTGLLSNDGSYVESVNTESFIIGATEFLDTEGVIELQPSETIDVSKKSDGHKIYEKLKRIEEIFANTFIGDPETDIGSVNNKHILKSIINNKGILQNSVSSNMNNNIFKTAYVGFQSSDFIKKLANTNDCKVNKECQELTKEIVEMDIPELTRNIFDDREDVAMELIAKNLGEEQKIAPLVYGSAHDFTRAVKKWNDAHPEQQFNLVTVKSQNYF